MIYNWRLLCTWSTGLYLTYLGCGHKMSRAVEHVINPAGDPEIPVSIALCTIPRHVVAREAGEIGFLKPFMWGLSIFFKANSEQTCLDPHRQCAWCQAKGGRTQCNLHLLLSPEEKTMKTVFISLQHGFYLFPFFVQDMRHHPEEWEAGLLEFS